MNNVKRGQQWENMLSLGFGALGRCSVEKMPAPTRVIRFTNRAVGKKNTGEFLGYFEKKGVCDFEGGFEGRVVCCEAKRTQSKRWNFTAVKPHQRSRMVDTAVDQKGIAGVLLAMDHVEGSSVFFGIDIVRFDLWCDSSMKSVSAPELIMLSETKGSGVWMLPLFATPKGPAIGLLKFMSQCRRLESY